MVSTNAFRSSPTGIARLVAALLAALIVGGVSGYVIRGFGTAAASGASSTAGRALETSPYLYMQGGRPKAIYALPSSTPSLYVQGGRPQAVYDDAARIEAQLSR